MSANYAEVENVFATVFRDVHGEVPFTLRFVEEIGAARACSALGSCDFSVVPPEIEIRTGLDETNLIDVLCHEFAHLICGLAAGHDDSWETCRDRLSVRYGAHRVAQTKRSHDAETRRQE